MKAFLTNMLKEQFILPCAFKDTAKTSSIYGAVSKMQLLIISYNVAM